MQPNPPGPPGSRYVARPPRRSSGPSLAVGLIALLGVVFLLDHAGKGETAVFSGVDQRISTQDFRRAQCTTVFGGCKIDLRDAQIQGEEAFVDAYAIFGGVEIWVPETWELVKRDPTIFGSVSDRRRHIPSGPGAKTLILNGASVFGGVTVRN